MDKTKDLTPLINALQKTPPQVYLKIKTLIPDKKGHEKEKLMLLDGITGDVFKNRKLEAAEAINSHFYVGKTSKNGKTYKRNRMVRDEGVIHTSYERAYITNEGVLVVMWVFADDDNYKNVTPMHKSYYGPIDVGTPVLGNKVNENAVCNYKIAKPQIASAILIDKNKNVHTWDDYDRYVSKHSNTSPNANAISWHLISRLYDPMGCKNIIDLQGCFKEFFKIGYLGANRFVGFEDIRDIAYFMKTKPMVAKPGPKQNLIDELNKQTTINHTDEVLNEKVCFADRINDEWAVLRWYLSVGNSSIETSRMYVNKDTAILCRSDLLGNWVHAPAKIKSETFNASRVIMSDENVFDGTKLEYFKQISTEMANQSAALYMLTVYPEFEKMYKMGLSWICDSYLESPYQFSWKSHLDTLCGHINWDAKGILQMLGINSHQAAAMKEYMSHILTLEQDYWQKRYCNNIIRTMKNIFVTNRLNDIDNDTFDYILNSMRNKKRTSGYYTSALARTFDIYGMDAMHFIRDLNAISDGDQLVPLMRNGNMQTVSIDMIYSDLMRMVQCGNYTDRIRPRFDSVDELIRCHDIMVDLINADEAAHTYRTTREYIEGFQKNKPKWIAFEYDDDKEFCVIAPKDPVDIAEEGMNLHHCVKSFIPAVSKGETNVVFIRRKGFEDVPFFTVEVDNNKTIRQAHGNCNCNASTVPGLTEFITKWAKEKKLKYSSDFANGIRAAR